MVFAGSTAILNMSGPIDSMCAGRIDSFDGTDSLVLGPSDEAPVCEVQGDCRYFRYPVPATNAAYTSLDPNPIIMPQSLFV